MELKKDYKSSKEKIHEISENNSAFEFDSIFAELGEFGKFQIINYCFISVAIFVYATISLGYVFTAGNLNYR